MIDLTRGLSSTISLESVDPPPIASDESDSSTTSTKSEEIQRLEHRLDVANSRFDSLTSRMDDLELIRKERVERRRRRRQVPVESD